jgi:hypothetical protein
MLRSHAAEQAAGVDQQQQQGLLCVRLRSWIESLAGGLRSGLGNFGDDPFHLPGTDFVLGDAARLAGTGLYDRRRATLELAGPTGGHEDIAIVAVEAFDQLHTVLP